MILKDSKKNNELNYVPEIVDIEGLQGMNSSQGIDYLMQDIKNMPSIYDMSGMEQSPMWDYNTPPMQGMDNMYNMPPMQGMDNMYSMPPMQGMDNMYSMPPMQGMDSMYNMPPMQGVGYGNRSQCSNWSEVISCMATVCYMMSVFFSQMIQGNNPMNPYPTKDCDCMQNYNTNYSEGYPPIY